MSSKVFVEFEERVFGYGYGSGEEPILEALRVFVSTIPEGERQYDYRVIEHELGAPTTWLLINALCNSDYIDYGTSPRFGWIDNDELLDYIRNHSVDEMIKALEENRWRDDNEIQ